MLSLSPSIYISFEKRKGGKGQGRNRKALRRGKVENKDKDRTRSRFSFLFHILKLSETTPISVKIKNRGRRRWHWTGKKGKVGEKTISKSERRKSTRSVLDVLTRNSSNTFFAGHKRCRGCERDFLPFRSGRDVLEETCIIYLSMQVEEKAEGKREAFNSSSKLAGIIIEFRSPV